jgi:predicted TIM-barrel fold metal-dependent hydrolase
MSVGELKILAGLDGQVPSALAEALTTMPLVDHHVHGCFTSPLTRGAFEQALNEGSLGPIPAFMTQFDSQPGLAIRRWCAPRLGLPPHASAEDYWARRASLSVEEVDRVMLGDAGVERWIIDTGFGADTISSLETMTERSGAPSSEILRLERLAEGILARGGPASSFASEFRAALARSKPFVVGYKSIAAYRTGFDIDWSMPWPGDLKRAVAEVVATSAGPVRLDNPVITSFIVHAAAELGLPIQFHVGLGDRDLDLHRTNPMLLLPLLRQAEIAETPVMLLHTYPYHRESGYLAQAFDNVYFDVGLTLNHLGTQSSQIVAESLELAPFAKQLYSSDAFGLPELHLLGSILWRRSMAQVLGKWVREGDWSEPDAIRVAEMIGRGNARRAYGV